MTRCLPVLIAAACLSASAQSQRPPFTVTPEVPAMPKALMKLPRTPISRAKFPTVDFHFHGGQLKTADDYRKIVKQMDEIGVGVLCNMDGGFGADFDRNLKVSEPFKDRVLQFARIDFNGINQPGWSAKTAAELERDFLAGAVGLKINKVLGLDLQNTDGTYIQADDPRFDPIWEMAAKHNKPVMIHISDSYGRFLPIGPENERYEAGLWRSSAEGNYYGTGQPTPDVIEKAREHMHAKHPNTRFVNAHMAMLYYDMDKVASLLDRFPNADVELSATVQDLGRAPRMTREFFLKYQDRILFGSDGNPGRGNDEFWEPHWRFLETYDEHFDHPAQLRSATGAPLHGRWRISGMSLPDEVLRKVYYTNALRYLPAARATIEKRLTAGSPAAALPIAPDRLLNAGAEPGNWLTYSGDYRGHHYSGLDQITTANVQRLKPKWIFQMHRQKIETTPIVVDGVMYVTRPPGDVIALDAETGRALWTYEHRASSRVYTCCGEVNRGAAILGGTLFLTTLDAQLVALDARSGRVLWKKPIADPAMNYTATGAPLAVKDKVIVGIAGAEGGIRGFLDAYDAKTGTRVWRFWTVPSPGEPGSDTWAGEAWKNGGASTWLTGSYDPELNLLYWGTGNPGPDYNGDVRPGDNLYSSTLLALDLDTGRLKWHFQFTPHDTRDYDATQIPVLIDSDTGRKLVVVPSRNGFYYVLDRRTGEFLLAKPFVKVTWAKEIDKKGRPVMNPGQEPTTDGNDGIWPGVDGGHNWMSPSYHPVTKLLYFNAREERRRFFKTDAPEFRPGEAFFGGGGGGGARFRPEESWGKLVAMSPESGEIKWEHRILAPPWAGVLSTAGNLVFSATPAGNVYALDARTGNELWHFNGGGPVYASPITFLSRGRQMIALPIGDNVIVFGLD